MARWGHFYGRGDAKPTEQVPSFKCWWSRDTLFGSRYTHLLASCGQPTVSLVAFIQFYPRNRDARNTLRLCGFASNEKSRPQGHGGDYS